MEHTKVCSNCKIEKNKKDFSKNKTKKDGLCPYCRLCYKQINKLWRQKNPEKDKKIHEKWKKNNKKTLQKSSLRAYYRHHEKNKKLNRDYKRKNKELLKTKNRAYINKRYKEDFNYRLLVLTRGRIRKALKRNSKNSSSLELLGCSIEQLKIHLEKQFLENMSWDNYGKWHIDHKIPCSSFDLSDPEQQKKCFHFSNLQPLWAEDNLRKSDKII